jgi:hypothetical protein
MEVHESQRRGILERVVLRLLLVRPLRCDNCKMRFFRLISWKPEPIQAPIPRRSEDLAFRDLEQALTTTVSKPMVPAPKAVAPKKMVTAANRVSS